MRVHLDLELGSPLNLKKVGADVWARHPNTIPILCGFAIDNEPAAAFDYLAGDKALTEKLMTAIRDGAVIHAWNASFEATVWRHLLVPRYGYPPLPVERFQCTMAAAACAGLPMELAKAAPAVGASHVKDKAGSALMQRMAKPRAENPDGSLRWWHVEDPARLARLRDYNIADVEAEREIACLIPAMSWRERQIWLCDQRMNMRGLPVDNELLQELGQITAQEILRLDREIAGITGGLVSSQGARLLDWLKCRGYPFDSLDRRKLSDFVGSPEYKALPAVTRRVLSLRAEAAKTSTAKLHAIGSFASHDGLARQLVQYGGATRTLRWAGRGPQIQNFPRPIIKRVDLAIAGIIDGLDADALRTLFGRPLDVVSSCLRGVFKAADGQRFVVCDYHAIEAVVLAWLAEDRALLDVFARGEDVYVYTAQGIGSQNRTLGKVMRLALGFGMGPVKFRDTARGYGIDLSLEESEIAVEAFRLANTRIVDLWYSYETAARQVIANPALGTLRVGRVGFRMALSSGKLAGSLLIEKPSGSVLVYRNARLENGIVFDGVDQFTKKWGPIRTYGGKLVENVTQSVARDLLADAMLEFEKACPDCLRVTVHDEIAAIALESDATQVLATLKRIMSEAPWWGEGLPLSGAGYVATRYGKA